MKYISKGIVVEGSTEHILRLTRCGYDFQLTGEQAVLWLNGRFGFAEVEDGNPILIKLLCNCGIRNSSKLWRMKLPVNTER